MHPSLGGKVEMNIISKVGLFTYIINFILMIFLMLLSQKIPDFLMYVFGGSLIITIVGAMKNQRKDQLP